MPDGLAAGLLAGVNPIFGLYGYAFGHARGRPVHQFPVHGRAGHRAMAAVMADVPEVRNGENPERVLLTLAIVTGVFMVVAGFLNLGSVLRFVSNAVMVASSATSASTSCWANSTISPAMKPGLDPSGPSLRPAPASGPHSLGDARRRDRGHRSHPLARADSARSLVVATVIGSTLVVVLGENVAKLEDIVEIPRGLPAPRLPLLGSIPSLLVPGASLAFVGVIQGAGI